MPRYKLTIEYDGTAYKGWQRQEGLATIQGALEETFLHFTQHECTLFAAGRTDAGVHALGQVAHVDLQEKWQPWKILEAANGVLRLNGHPVALVGVEEAADDFDARFSATKRHYRYRIINRKANLTVDLDRFWHVRKPLDCAAMDKAAKLLTGRHDFTTFRSTDCQAKSPVRSLESIQVRRVESVFHGDTEIDISCSARAFLHNQIRSIAGSLKLVGEGRWTEQDLQAALDARDRTACGPVAPACGLYFMKVDY